MCTKARTQTAVNNSTFSRPIDAAVRRGADPACRLASSINAMFDRSSLASHWRRWNADRPLDCGGQADGHARTFLRAMPPTPTAPGPCRPAPGHENRYDEDVRGRTGSIRRPEKVLDKK
jgi:hypothetical protein